MSDGTDNLEQAMRDVASHMKPTIPRTTGATELDPVAQVLIRAPRSSHERWKRAAGLLGVSLAQYVRDLADAKASELLDCRHPEHMIRNNQWGKFCHQCGVQVKKRRNG
jgi:hypothetical protein